jgi:hypothetical protein
VEPKLIKELVNTPREGLSLAIADKPKVKGSGRVRRVYTVTHRITSWYRPEGEREYKAKEHGNWIEMRPKDAVALANAILEHYSKGKVTEDPYGFEVPEEWIKDGDEE